MSHFAAVIAIPFFLSLFYRADLARFLAPLWIAIYVASEGFIFTWYGFITFVSCIIVALFVVYSMFFRKKVNGDKTASVNLFDGEEQDSGSTSTTRVKRTELKVYTGVIESFGIAPWKDDPQNDKSFFVKLEGQNKVWAKGLKLALETCGADIGDQVSFWKSKEIRTNRAEVMNDNGEVVGYRDLQQEKRRGFWEMEIQG